MKGLSNLKDIHLTFDGLSDDSRIWIFQADKKLNSTESEATQNALRSFLPSWTSHNRALMARGTVAFDQFIVIALDQSQSSAASGCSIDSMTHHIESIGRHLNVNLQDRMTFHFLKDGETTAIHMHDVKDAYQKNTIDGDSLVFDNLVKSLGDLKSKWLVPLNKSWHKRFI